MRKEKVLYIYIYIYIYIHTYIFIYSILCQPFMLPIIKKNDIVNASGHFLDLRNWILLVFILDFETGSRSHNWSCSQSCVH